MNELEILKRQKEKLMLDKKKMQEKNMQKSEIAKLKRENFALKNPKKIAFVKGVGVFSRSAANLAARASTSAGKKAVKFTEQQAKIHMKQTKGGKNPLKDLL